MDKDNQVTTINNLIHQIVFQEQKAVEEGLDLKQIGSKITAQQAMVLNYINTNPGAIQRDIANIVGRRAATVSTLLKKMEEDNLIIRKIPNDNSRNKELYLTDQARKVVGEFNEIYRQVQTDLVQKLDQKQRAQLIDLLALLTV